MRIKTRLTVLVMVALLGVGGVSLVVNALMYQHTVYKSPQALSRELLSKIGVSRQAAEEYIRQHPEVVFDPTPDAAAQPGRPSINEAFQSVQRSSQTEAVHRAWLWTAIAVGALTVAAGLAGWLVAVRALRPLRAITERARAAAAGDLTGRVALQGPEDEVKALADTFDAMLARLEASFTAQRRFSGQVSHELRTPLSVIHSETDLILADEDEDARPAILSIRDATVRAERIVTGLLALARSEGGNLDETVVMLDELVGDAVADMAGSREWSGLRLDVDLEPATVIGDRALLESLVRNLVDNAVRHNRAAGWLRVGVAASTEPEMPGAVLTVENSTAVATRPAEDSNRIGLTVVRAIVDAHGGWFAVDRPDDATFRAVVRVPGPRTNQPTATPSRAASTDGVDQPASRDARRVAPQAGS